MKLNFIEQLNLAWHTNNSLLCVGLDPDPERFPKPFHGDRDKVFEFNKAIIDATADLVCAFKPQIAHYAALGAEDQLQQSIDYIHENYSHIPVVLDSKRGDIGSTAERYAVEAFRRFGADATTVNPYLGYDSVAPFLKYKDKGVIILCRTSNGSAGDFQDLKSDGRFVYERVAEKAASEWNAYGNCLLVVGATYPRELGAIRNLVGAMPILVPGIGVQGGDVEKVVNLGCTADGAGLIISSSRGVLYASQGEDFAQAARQTASDLRNQINQFRP